MTASYYLSLFINKVIKLHLVSLLYIALCLLSARADDWTTSDGKTYTNVTVVKSDADSVTILDKDGGARIPLASLPPDLRKQFNYTPLVQNPSAADTNDTTPVKVRPEWAQRLSQLASVLQEMKKEGGAFTAKGSAYNWKDITEIAPTSLSYMTDSGAGKISFQDLSPDLAAKLTLSSAEANKWNSEELQRQQSINSLHSKGQLKGISGGDMQYAYMSSPAYEVHPNLSGEDIVGKINGQIAANGKADQEKRDAETAAAAAKATSQASFQAQQAAQAQQAQQALQTQQALQAAQQAKAASIAALQAQIDALLQQRLGISESARYDTGSQSQLSDINNRISALHDQINSLKSGYH